MLLLWLFVGEWNGLGVAKSTENDMMPRLASPRLTRTHSTGHSLILTNSAVSTMAKNAANK
jgi:hypothetical protein